jgi:hypothetical protein
LVDGHQFLAEPLPALEFSDLPLGFAQSGGRGKTFIDGLSVHLAGEAELRIVPRIVPLGTVTSWFSTAAQAGSDGPRSKIGQTEELFK